MFGEFLHDGNCAQSPKLQMVILVISREVALLQRCHFNGIPNKASPGTKAGLAT